MKRRRNGPRRAFTLAELLVAGVIIAFVWGAVTTGLRQLAIARGATRTQLDAYLRADAALTHLRRDLCSVLRSDDLFWTRVLLTDGSVNMGRGYVDRDEILVFNSQVRPVRRIDYIGEGMEYETQYRIQDDDLGPVLWQRRDPVPDEYLLGGGVATPLADGIVSLAIQAYDGEQWYENWDSDIDGLPWALRVMVTASGHRPGEDPMEAPLAMLRTVIPIDRVPLPPTEEEGAEAGGGEAAGEPGETGDTGGASGSGGGDGGAAPPGRGGRRFDQPPGGQGQTPPGSGPGGRRRGQPFTGSSQQ